MQNPNPKWQKHRDRKGKGECAHLRETGGDLGPEGVDQVVELNLWCALRIEPVCFDICVEQREFA